MIAEKRFGLFCVLGERLGRSQGAVAAAGLFALLAMLWAAPATAQSSPAALAAGPAALQKGAVTLPYGSPIPAGYKMSPGGVYRHKACVVPVPKNARVWPDRIVRDENGNELRNLQQPCPYPAYTIAPPDDAGAAPAASTNGWISYAYQWAPSGDAWTELETEVFVPSTPSPANPGASISYWSGIEPTNHSNLVLQPILAWGDFNVNPSWFDDFEDFGINTYYIAAVAQFTGADGGWFLCAGSGGSTGVGNSEGEDGCTVTNVNPNDTIQFLVELFALIDQCGNQMTDTGIQYECGEWAWYIVNAADETLGGSNSQGFIVGQVLNAGSNQPPNGSVFPLALPAVYESYNDLACESGAVFGVEALAATASFTSVSYSPTICPSGAGAPVDCYTPSMGNSGCSDGVTVFGDLTAVY